MQGGEVFPFAFEGWGPLRDLKRPAVPVVGFSAGQVGMTGRLTVYPLTADVRMSNKKIEAPNSSPSLTSFSGLPNFPG